MNQSKSTAEKCFNQAGNCMPMDLKEPEHEVKLVRKLCRLEDFVLKTFMAAVMVALVVAATAVNYFLMSSIVSGVPTWPIALGVEAVLLVASTLVVRFVCKRIRLRRELREAGYFNLDKSELSKWLDEHQDLRQELFALEAARM